MERARGTLSFDLKSDNLSFFKLLNFIQLWFKGPRWIELLEGTEENGISPIRYLVTLQANNYFSNFQPPNLWLLATFLVTVHWNDIMWEPCDDDLMAEPNWITYSIFYPTSKTGQSHFGCHQSMWWDGFDSETGAIKVRLISNKNQMHIQNTFIDGNAIPFQSFH